MKDDLKFSKSLKKFTVTDYREKKEGFLNPVIVTFQNGELNENHASKFNAVLTAKDGSTKVEVKTSYGHVFKDSRSNNQPRPKQIIAIRNKKTNKVTLVEVDSAILINSALLHVPEPESKQNVDSKDYGKEVRALNKTFGGKRIRNVLEQKEKLNFSSLPIAEELKKAVEDMEVEENVSFLDAEKESVMDLLPPCHRDAKSISEVYLINEILSEEELQALKEHIINVVEKNPVEKNDFSELFIKYHSEIVKSDVNVHTRLAGLLFAEALINFLIIPTKKLRVKNAVLCQFSSVIQEKIIKEFCIKTETSINRPLAMRDKSLCYIITLCLICCNYQVDVKLLATVTSAQFNRLTKLARTVGAVPIAKDENVFVLKFPLPALPKISRPKARKK